MYFVCFPGRSEKEPISSGIPLKQDNVSYISNHIISTQNRLSLIHSTAIVFSIQGLWSLCQNKEVENVEERGTRLAGRLCLNLNWTIISMWLPAGSLANPEDAASASHPGPRYLKMCSARGQNLRCLHLSELVSSQVGIQLGHYTHSISKHQPTIFRFRMCSELFLSPKISHNFRNTHAYCDVFHNFSVAHKLSWNYAWHWISDCFFVCLMLNWKLINSGRMEQEIKYIGYTSKRRLLHKQQKLLIQLSVIEELTHHVLWYYLKLSVGFFVLARWKCFPGSSLSKHITSRDAIIRFG